MPLLVTPALASYDSIQRPWSTDQTNISGSHKLDWKVLLTYRASLGGSDSKASASSAGDLGSIPGSGRPPEEGNGNPLQYSYLENTTDRGAWWATVHGATKELDMT